MIDLSRLRRHRRGHPEVIIISLIDIMMVLLVFLLSTACSTRETGLKVMRPHAVSSRQLDATSIPIGVGAQGELSFEGRRIEHLALRALIRERLAERPDAPVVLVADTQTPAGVLVAVMDEVQRGGATRVAIASRKEER